MEAFWIILVASLVAINSSLIGSFLVLRKSTMMGDAISHAVLPGIVISYLFSKSISSFSVILGATVTGMLAMFLISFFNKKAHLQLDASIGVIFTFLFAVGVILISAFTKKADLDQDCVLYGEIIHIPLKLWITKGGTVLGPKAVYTLLFVLIINVSLITFCYRELHITSFDESYASTLGIKTSFWHYIIMSSTSLTTVAAFESVGAILVVAFLSVPTAAAYLLSNRLPFMLVLSCIFGVLISIAGYFVALYLNVPVSGSMSSVAAIIFILSFIIYRRIYGK